MVIDFYAKRKERGVFRPMFVFATVLTFFTAFWSNQAIAQSLTISTGASSGSGWSLSSGTLTVTATSTVNVSVITNALNFGSLTIVGNTTNFTVWVATPISSTTVGSNLTIGSSSNTGTITFSSAISLNGALTVNGGDVALNANITLTALGADVVIKSTNEITASGNQTFTTNNGDFILWTDSDNSGQGRLHLLYTQVINTANGSTSSGLSGGGKIVLAGGLDNGANGGTSNDGLPDGFAANASGIGLYFGCQGCYTQMFSGGGDIIIRGSSTYASSGVAGIGVYTDGRWLANAGKGSISIQGTSTHFYGINLTDPGGSNSTATSKYLQLISDKASGTAVSITGTSNLYHGVVFNYENPKEVLATGGGAIEINGTGGSFGPGVFLQNTDILATSGNITLTGTGTPGVRVTYVGTRFGSRAGTSITSSTSNIRWSVNSMQLDALASGFTNDITTSGTATIEPSGTSFTSAITYPITNFTVAGTVSGLTIGKSGNTANLTIGSDLSIAGPINLYAGTLTLNGNLASTSSGDISLYSDAALGGLSSARTITTSGAFKYIPQSTSFSSAVTFPITNLTLSNVTGVEIGKSGNTAGVTIGSPTSVNGYFNAFGGAIALNSSIATTNTSTGNISLTGTTVSGTGNLVLAAGRTATINVSSTSSYDGIISGSGSGFTKAGAGLLTLTKDHTYTGATTISAGNLQVGSGGSVDQASSGTLAAASAVSVASGSRLILAPNENITFGNAVSGAGGVEIRGMSGRYYNTFLNATAAQMVLNSSVLEVLTRITGGVMGGANASGVCGAYRKSYNASTNVGTIQFQHYTSGDNLTKVVYVTLERINTTNVAIRATGAASRTGNVVGQDMTTLSPTTQPLATSAGASGYGISQVFMSGKVNFTGILTYTGTTTLSDNPISGVNPTYSYTSRGTQEITNTSASFPSGSPVVNNGLIILNRSSALTISNDLSGTEEILQVGAEITLTGTNTYSGATTIDLNKTLNIGSGGTTGSLTGNIVNYGTLVFNRSNASVYPGIISGTGTITKSGSGDLTLTGLNTYTGATTVSAGRLILERDIPATSSSEFGGAGTLVIQPSSASFTNAVTYPISGITVSSSIGGLVVGKLGNTSTITIANATTVAGPITFYGGTVNVNENIAPTNNGNISLYANTLNFGSGKTVASGGELLVAPSTVGNTIGVAGSSGNLLIPDTYFTANFADGFSNITIGSSDQTGNVVTRQVTLRSNISFRTTGSLTLENSPFDIGTRNMTLGSSMTVLGMPTNYIKTSSTGVVRRSIGHAGSGLFPVGNGSYNPVSITNNNGSADDFSARVADEVLSAGTSGTAFTERLVNRTWHIDKSAANADPGVDMTFQWESNQELGTFSDYKLSHFGTIWALATGTSGSVSGTTTKTMTHTGYTGSFSPFGIGSTGGALPVSWVDFTAVRTGQTVELNWRTGSEQNTKDFVVQHSTGNGTWKNIGNVAAAGFSSSVRSYRFTHTQPVDGRNQYRLLQRDLDGKESLSKVVSVVMPSATSVQVYPVPSTNGSVFVKLPADQVMKVFNSTGILMLEQQGKAGVQSLDLQSLPKGLYYLQAGKETVRVMLQ